MAKYKIHRARLSSRGDAERLEKFLNSLKGEVVSVIPEIRTFFLFYGAQTKSVLVIEKIKSKK
jgi:hypothetical protein